MPYDRSAFIIRNPVEGVCFETFANGTQFIADKLFDPKPVDNALAKVPQIDASKLRVYNDQKGTNSEPNLIDEQLFYRDITLREYKLASEINPRDERDAAAAGKMLLSEARKANIVTHGLLIAREAAAAALATTAANYPSALQVALAAGDRWDDNGDIEAHMATANAALRASCGRNANALAIDIATYDKLRLGTNLRTRTQYTMGTPVSDDIIKAYFGVDFLFVGKAQRNSAIEGLTASVAGFWGRFAVAFVYDPGISMEKQGFGTMWWINQPFRTDVFVDMKRTGAAGPMRRVQVATEYLLDPGFVESSTSSKFAAGYLFSTVVAA